MNQDYRRLKKYLTIWKRKKMLRLIYREWYEKINQDLQSGKTLELGSGTGNFKQFNPKIISSDIVACEWLDLRIDAHKIPFPANSLANIVMIDVFHHLGKPGRFFQEAYRVLKPGGRIILLEPFPSPVSLLVYRLFHPEPFIFNIDAFTDRKKRQPWDSNQALAYLLFFKQLKKIQRLFAGRFRLISREKFSFLLYPLSGGFEHRQLIPERLIPLTKIFERLLSPFRDILAFRCYIVLEKNE